MKLEEMIMVVENRKGTETNYLLDLKGYMETALNLWGENAEDMAGAVGELYATKERGRYWADLYFASNKSIHAAFCRSEAQLREFLAGTFNALEWSFDEGRCSKGCLDVLRIYNMKPDGQPQFPYLHYENVEHTFHAGETLHNLNGKDYLVLAVLSPDNLLLTSLTGSQLLVGCNVQLYERYPKGERPDSGSMVEGVEWGHGVYLDEDITRLDFDILKQEYGRPGRVESLPDKRDQIRRDFWMLKNVERKEGLPERVRNSARSCLGTSFGTINPDVFAKMLEKGMYDDWYQGNEKKKDPPGWIR